jgi:hypothetical protein
MKIECPGGRGYVYFACERNMVFARARTMANYMFKSWLHYFTHAESGKVVHDSNPCYVGGKHRKLEIQG